MNSPNMYMNMYIHMGFPQIINPDLLGPPILDEMNGSLRKMKEFVLIISKMRI